MRRHEEAVAAYRAALEEKMHERGPLQWARTQMNLGNALGTLGERESGTARLGSGSIRRVPDGRPFHMATCVGWSGAHRSGRDAG
jgi:hypothetical protein